MKTKIIYISGSDVFEMADIRAAFNEVRNTLNLQDDTVLFGVPVDADDAGLHVGSSAPIETDAMTSQEISDIPLSDFIDETTDLPPCGAPISAAAEDSTDKTEVDQSPKKTAMRKSRGRAKAAVIIDEDAPLLETSPDASEEPVSEKIIPILSFLASKPDLSKDMTATPTTEIITDEPTELSAKPDRSIMAEDIDTDALIVEAVTVEADEDDNSIIESVMVERVTISDDDFEPEIVTTEEVTLVDMIVDDAPVTAEEKTLEQLLEKMAPLREDHINDDIESTDDTSDTEMDTDATLAQLANEFVEKQDEIISTPRVETAGKIGKLKNILPFKKAKREDAGIMGDLFGWAGIAANDDEFSIPGFFTTTASKK